MLSCLHLLYCCKIEEQLITELYAVSSFYFKLNSKYFLNFQMKEKLAEVGNLFRFIL